MKNPINNADDLGDIIRKSMDEVTAIARKVHKTTGQNATKEGKLFTKNTDPNWSVATRDAKTGKITHQVDKNQLGGKSPDRTANQVEGSKKGGKKKAKNQRKKFKENVNPIVKKTANASFSHGNLTGRETGKALGRSDAIEEVKPVLKKKDKTIKILKTTTKIITPIGLLAVADDAKQRRDKNKIKKQYEELLKKYNAK